MIPSLKSSENTAFCVVGVVKRPSGGIEERAGGVIPHYVGPTTLLRHSLPAHSSLPLIFADLIRASFKKERQRRQGPVSSVIGRRLSACGRRAVGAWPASRRLFRASAGSKGRRKRYLHATSGGRLASPRIILYSHLLSPTSLLYHALSRSPCNAHASGTHAIGH